MKIKEIIQNLEKKCSLKYVLEKDPSGWQIGNTEEEVKNILISLDCSKKAIIKAIKNKCNFIITHHPVFWPDKETGIQEDLYQKSKAKLLLKNKIVVYSMHSNYDEKFLKKQLLKKVFLDAVPFNSEHSIIYAKLPHNSSMLTIMKTIKEKLHLPKINYWSENVNVKVKSFAFIPGAGNSLLGKAIEKKIDLIITGEIKWSNWILCRDYKQSIVTIGHQTEQLFVEKVASWIEKTTLKSKTHQLILNYEKLIDTF